jgi:hypothetical protein
VALTTSLGCERGEQSRANSGSESGQGIEIQWPGGSVKIDPDEGVKVKAPGVDVEVDQKKGVDVDTPGVDVRVRKGSRGPN